MYRCMAIRTWKEYRYWMKNVLIINWFSSLYIVNIYISISFAQENVWLYRNQLFYCYLMSYNYIINQPSNQPTYILPTNIGLQPFNLLLYIFHSSIHFIHFFFCFIVAFLLPIFLLLLHIRLSYFFFFFFVSLLYYKGYLNSWSNWIRVGHITALGFLLSWYCHECAVNDVKQYSLILSSSIFKLNF